MQAAGEEILADESEGLRFHWTQPMVERITRGEILPRFDVTESNLTCLVMPMPSQPGVIQNTGGTGIYTRNRDSTAPVLVFAGHQPVRDAEGAKVTVISHTAEFCEQDVPAMARLVCELALGEYRKDLRSLLINLYKPDSL